ncbi:MAG: hypothetical protein ACO3JF_03065 [Ilumatobacteraceae bacterium]
MALGGQLTHVYRAIWIDNSLNVSDVLFDNVQDWLRGRGTPMEVKRDEVVVHGFRTATWSRFENSLGRAEQFNLIEEHEGNWVTSITAIWTPENNVFWADVRTELPQSQVGIVKAPSIVRALLLSGGEPQIGRDNIEVQPREVDDHNSLDELLVGLSDSERVIPYLVYRVGEKSERRQSMQRATRASETLAGLAQVFVVDEQSVRFLNGVLPTPLRLDEVGARLFMPMVMEQSSDEKLTYFVPSSDLGDDQKQLGRMMLRRIGITSQWPEVPVTWAMLKRECDQVRTELLSVAKENGADIDTGAIPRPTSTNEAMDEELERLRSEISYFQDEALTAAIAAEENSENAQRLFDQLVTHLSNGEAHTSIQNFRSTIGETIAATRASSMYLVIPRSAEQSIDVLEMSASSTVWARDLSQLFVSMERYAHAVAQGLFKGDYMLWCQTRGDYSTQKIAMNESDPTQKDPTLRSKRVFEVSTELDVQGLKLMLSHVKIQLRGGPQIPRLFFHDDTKGRTGKIHIGFIGPHYLVPTSSF